MKKIANERSLLPLIRIETDLEVFRCEDCGSFQAGSVRITLPDGRVLSATHDGHFGGGCWSGQMSDVYFWCLQALGVELRVNGSAVQEQPFRIMSAETQGCKEVDLYPTTREILNLTVVMHPEPEDPRWDIPVSVSWRQADGRERTMLAASNFEGDADCWDGQVASLYECLLRERARVLQVQLLTRPLNHER